ncbi:MAG: hypothetical protein SO436_04685 [Oscillospiraceae bacterium]|jgi:hypothetical protein|uniref:Uncharacterized protein n=1 Tax=Siphoviridae sp. ct9UA16 TaxID=2827793 RepID=A0A8S5TM74_9CAUD|nr:hypothetical protein [Oscillospiraceae bacterium]MDD6983453.1 hypothetical protein [Oscillospiraceae bacterium]MDY2742410.1 hypothetical protein [Eubacteriales bacterium]MDY4623762.1 hypothetical protein [Oscillospiraceae bacterium]DAF64397.1 MAG TPA: hypothetical protein [Siphoviridae sp. ct9UA16]
MRIIDTGDAILSGDNHPQLKIGDKLYLVDDRKSTWDKIQQVQERGGDNVDAEILALALGKEAVAELVNNSDISVSGYTNLSFYVMAAITGEDYEDLKKAAKERKN